MGILAKFNGSKGNNLTLELFIGTVSQDIKANTSKVRVWATLTMSPYASLLGGTQTVTIHIDGGGAISRQEVRANSGDKITFFSREYVITHNPDGSRYVDYDLTLDTGFSIFGSATARGRYELQKIPRASDFTISAGKLGEPLKVTITKQQESYKHNVKWSSGNKSGVVASNIDTEANFTPALELASGYPNTDKVPVTITVETLSDGSLLSSKSSEEVLTIPDSIKPTFDGTLFTETSPAVTKVWPAGIAKDTFIQIISNIKAAPQNFKGVYGSTITDYKAQIVGKEATVTGLSGGSFGSINYSGALSVESYIVDSRGRKSETKKQTITILEYAPPSLSFKAVRSGSDSATITINRNASVSALTVNGKQNNEMTLTFRIGETGKGELSINSNGAGGSWLSIDSLINSEANLSGIFPANKTYTIEATLSDKFLSTTFKDSISTEQIPFSWDKDGIGIGKPKQRGGLDVVGNGYFEGSLDITGNYLKSGNPIQNHPLTNPDGSLIYMNASNRLDEITKTGFYNIQPNSAGNPFSKGAMLAVYKIGDSIIQDITSVNGDKASRYYDYTKKSWGAWSRYLKQKEEVKTQQVDLPSYMKGTLSKSGNMATLTINRNIANLVTGENIRANEALPGDFSPASNVNMVLIANSGSRITGQAIFLINTLGEIYLTNGTSGNNVWQGSVTYMLKQ